MSLIETQRALSTGRAADAVRRPRRRRAGEGPS